MLRPWFLGLLPAYPCKQHHPHAETDSPVCCWPSLPFQVFVVRRPYVFLKKKPRIAEKLGPFADAEVLEAVRVAKSGKAAERPVKLVELEALLAAPEGFGDDVPVDPNLHARRLPDRSWRRSQRYDGIEVVIQLHRLREVLALTGFTRFEAVTPDIHGEYETDVGRGSTPA